MSIVHKCIAKQKIAHDRAEHHLLNGNAWRAHCYLMAGMKLFQFAGSIDKELAFKLAKAGQ